MAGSIGIITTLIFILGVVFIILRMKEDEEEYYWLKIIGYYFLGAFRFSFNKLHIPLGFIIFLAFFREPQFNRRGKRYAAGLGLAAFVIALAIPAISESYFERSRYIEAETTNVYEMDFQNHWKQVSEKLNLDSGSIQSAKLEDLNIDYEKNGKIRNLRYEFVWRQEGQLFHATVNYYENRKKFMIRPIKITEWTQYDRLISSERIFEMLDNINIKDLAPPVEAAYNVLSLGEWSNLGASDGKVFIIKDGKIKAYTGKLPVQCYWLKSFGMKKSGENSYTSVQGCYFIFDVNPN